MSRWPRTALVALCLALGSMGTGCKSSAEHGEETAAPTPVHCEAVTERAIDRTLHLRGTVSAPPNEDAVVSSAVAGRITSMHVSEGDTVAKGALLAVVDNPELATEQEKAAAAVTSAQATLDNAQQDLQRQRKLFDEGIAARRAVQDAEARVASAKGDLTTAKAQVHQAAQQSALAQVRAPIAGTVVKVTRGIGELVDGTPTSPIVEVANTSVLELSCDVPSTDLVRMDESVAAKVHLDALPDETIDGKVVRIAPTVDPTTSLGRVRIELSPPAALAKRLHIGMGGQATVATGRRQVLVVSPSALRRSQKGADEVVVCQEQAGGTVASVQAVTVGARGDSWVEITGGPAAGARVVVDRVLGLDDGTRLAPEKSDQPQIQDKSNRPDPPDPKDRAR